MSEKTKPLHVVLVGRVNVGKSTLFNRLVGARLALTSPLPGTTRDRREADVSWRHETFILVDTGGVEVPKALPAEEDLSASISKRISQQTNAAISGAALALLVVSAADGPLPQDRAWARALAGTMPVLLVMNKTETAARADVASEFIGLGIGTPYPVSAVSGRGTGDLLDAIVEALKPLHRTPRTQASMDALPGLRLAILGQPNSGKSSLLNAIIGSERMITSSKPHTTREPQDVTITHFGKRVTLVDTAGIRRQYQDTTALEKQGILASLKTIRRADAVVLMIDITRGPTFQDQRLASEIIEVGRPLIIAANKWDLIEEKKSGSLAAEEKNLRRQLPGLDWVPILFVSAKTKKRVRELLELAHTIEEASKRELTTDELKEFVAVATAVHRPSRGGGVHHPKVLALTQVGIRPPRFRLTVEGELHPSYLKYLEHKLREQFSFTGTPIHFTFGTPRPGATNHVANRAAKRPVSHGPTKRPTNRSRA